MQGHRLGINYVNNKKLTPSALTLWLLNADNTHVAGKTYAWIDSSAWDDLEKFKG